MTEATPKTFLSRLAAEDLKNQDRFKALVWWYGLHDRCEEASPAQIARDMQSAGYGRQDSSRIGKVLRADRGLAKAKGKAFSVKITSLPAFDALYRKFIQENIIEMSQDGVGNKLPDESNRIRSDAVVSHTSAALPTIFIGSSAEGLKYARALEKQLEHNAEVTIWKDGVFGLGSGTLETLVNELPRFDFAALVLTADDLTYSRSHTDPSPRDNVIFELGLFMGHIGRHRTFIVYNKDDGLKLPTDLAGVTPATFRNRADGNYHAQLSPPSTLIIDAIQKHRRIKQS